MATGMNNCKNIYINLIKLGDRLQIEHTFSARYHSTPPAILVVLSKSRMNLERLAKIKENGILNEMGYEIEVVQINEYNRLTIEMYDREVFRCDIRNLMFNMMAEDDPVCQRAVKAVEEARYRMCDEKNVPGYGAFSKGRRELNAGPTYRPSIQDVLSSSTELLYEIKPQGCHSIHKKKSPPAIEEKISKVTIMEDKNTFLGLGDQDNAEHKTQL